MALQPRLLLDYFVVFLIFNPEYISNKMVSGEPPKLDFFKAWLPENETLKTEQGGTVILRFDEKVIDKSDELHYTQQLEILTRFLGGKYTRIVLRVSHLKIQMFKKTYTTELLNAIFTENEIRRDQNINLIEVYLQITVKFFLERESLEAIHFLTVGPQNSIAKHSNINGFIFETSTQDPIQLKTKFSKTVNDAVYLAVQKFETFLNTMESTHGYKMKLGLAVNSVDECESVMHQILINTVSLFETVVYKYNAGDICQRKIQANQCIRPFIKEFSGMEFHKIQQVFGITTI